MIADDAHRRYYIDRPARNLRDSLTHASFIGFTGTPILARSSAITSASRDIKRVVADEATVPIYYGSRVSWN